MESKYNYKILPEYRLIISYYSGKISENEIISLKETIKSDNAYNEEYNVLDDFSGTNFNLTNESFSRVLYWLKDNFSSERNSAVLTGTPNQVANIMKFQALKDVTLPMRIKIFSTLNAALKWVEVPENHTSDIEKLLKELRD